MSKFMSLKGFSGTGGIFVLSALAFDWELGG